MRTRQERLHHLERCKLNRKNDFLSGKDSKSQGIHVKTPASCSCWMCGNPRRYFNMPTIQEIKSSLNLKEFFQNN